jgi:NADPH2:quinone reductase
MSTVIAVNKTGGPEVLSREEREIGAPGPREVRLRQTAVGVNFIDTYQRSGFYPMPMPFAVGDRVCYQGRAGAYATDRLIDADLLVPIPDGIDDQTAAAILLKGLTAYYLLFKTWPVQAGETILWHAAAGGTGQIATQWAKALGVTVIGTAGSDEKTALAKAQGCDHVINYRTEDFVARVKEITGGRGVDVVYDGVGKSTFEGSIDCLRPRGLLASFGSASGAVTIPDLGILARKGSLYVTRPTSAHYFPDRADRLEGAKALFDAVLSGAIKVQSSKTYPLAEAAAAHRALEGRETTGSLILLP